MLSSDLKKLHDSEITFENNFNVFEFIRSLHNEIDHEISSFVPSFDWRLLYRNILQLEKILDTLNISYAPCHNDICSCNILINEGKLILIDWERSGNNDPAWDIAFLSNSLRLNAEEEYIVLKAYFGNDISIDKKFVERVALYKPVTEFATGLWMMFQYINGNKFLSHADLSKFVLEKFEYTQALLAGVG